MSTSTLASSMKHFAGRVWRTMKTDDRYDEQMIRTMTTDDRYEDERTTRHRVTNNRAEKAMRRMKTDDRFEDERAMCSLMFVNPRRALPLPIQGRQCEILNHGDSRLQQGRGPQEHSCMAIPSFSKGKARRNIAATRRGQARGRVSPSMEL